MRIWVTLTAKQTEEANRVGFDRQLRADRRGAVDTNYVTGDRAEDLLVMQKACRCELAGHIGLKTKYWDTSPVPGGADLDGWIDVKERYLFSHGLSIPLKARIDYAYVSVCSERAPDYAIDGWCYGHEIILDKFKRTLRADRKPTYWLNPCIYIPPIKAPQQLMEIVKRKRPA